MGRPREHGDRTRAALIDAAERLLAERGTGALSIREVAATAGTTTRAVYALFGSKAGLVDALAAKAFDLLGEGVREYPVSDDPAADLVGIGTKVYHRFVTNHPSLFRIAFQRIVPGFSLTDELAAARERSFSQLELRMGRLEEAGGLPGRSPRAAAVEFNAMCEGLGNAEVRGGTMSPLAESDPEGVWRDSFEAIVAGLSTAPTATDQL